LARAPLWSAAVRSFKEKRRDRRDDHARLHLRKQQQCWLDDVGSIAAGKTSPAADLPWPACDWRADVDKLSQLRELLKACPPTGDETWCQAVEAHAASVFLREGEFWDGVEAPGYRLITSLQSAPAELRNLPLGDRLYIRSINERVGIGSDARKAASCLQRSRQLEKPASHVHDAQPTGTPGQTDEESLVEYEPFWYAAAKSSTIPLAGNIVQICGLQNRQDLNGTRGEILPTANKGKRVPVRLSLGDVLLKPVNLRVVYTAEAFARSSPDQIDWDAINQSLRERWAVDENGGADIRSSGESDRMSEGE